MGRKTNITLIGMPASGKSSVGIVLAKRLGKKFVDTDIVIQERYGKLLKELIKEYGDDGFRKIEDEVNAFISPGGSVVYGTKAMEHLKEISVVIYLELSYTAIKSRLGDLRERGITLKEGQTLKDLYLERTPLYEKYADITVNEMKKTLANTIDEICEMLGEKPRKKKISKAEDFQKPRAKKRLLKKETVKTAIVLRAVSKEKIRRDILRKMRIDFKPGNMLYPVPVVMVSCSDGKRNDIVTVAWTGTICTNPPMLYISLRPSRYSYDIIKKSGEFVINLTNERLIKTADECGVKSGRDIDKWKVMKIEQLPSKVVAAPSVKESPVCIECKVENILELGSHHMFIAKVVAVNVDSKYMDVKNKFDLTKADMVVYNHGEYIGLSKVLGTLG